METLTGLGLVLALVMYVLMTFLHGSSRVVRHQTHHRQHQMPDEVFMPPGYGPEWPHKPLQRASDRGRSV